MEVVPARALLTSRGSADTEGVSHYVGGARDGPLENSHAVCLDLPGCCSDAAAPAATAPLPPLPPTLPLVLPLRLAKVTFLAARGVLPGETSCRGGEVLTGTEGGRAVLAACTSESGPTRSVSTLESHPEMKLIQDAVAPPAAACRTREASVMRLLASARNTRSSSDCAWRLVAM